MTRDEIGAFFKARQGLWKAKDHRALADSHAIDSIVESPMFGRLQGRDAIRESYASLFATFPDWDLTIDDIVIDGSRVVQIFSVTATHVGEFMGLPGTNRRFTIQGVRVFEMGDGVIKHEKRMYDFTAMLVQVGVLKAKPARVN
jgi:steroid delta-isomerase-like uncharacterized protein